MRPPARGGTGPPGPRDGEGRPLGGKPADVEEVVTTPPNTYSTTITAQPRQCVADTLVGLRRRRQASRRMEWFCDCGPDPWLCRCQPALSDRQVQAAAAAAHHLLGENLPPIFDLVALWRSGYHKLVDRVRGVDDYDLAGGS